MEAVWKSRLGFCLVPHCKIFLPPSTQCINQYFGVKCVSVGSRPVCLFALVFLISFTVLCKVHSENEGNTWYLIHLLLAPALVCCAWTLRQIWLCFALLVTWRSPLPMAVCVLTWLGFAAGPAQSMAREASLSSVQVEEERTRPGLSPSLTMLASTRCLRRMCPKS